MNTFLKNFFSVFTVAVLFCALSASAQKNPAFKNSDQLILVTTPDWSSVPGTLRRFGWNASDAKWVEVGEKFPIVVGRNGLGWGRGLHPTNDLSGPIKKEGDGKSPAGIFKLTSAFGREPLAQVTYIKLPYRELTPTIECVDDIKSTNYNRIVDRERIGTVDWDSSEKMRDIGEQYRLGVVVEHNMDPWINGGGSCIFVHIWKSDKTGTAGCTAMTGEKMEELLHWLDSVKHPVLVQLPEKEYQRLQKDWGLPK